MFKKSILLLLLGFFSLGQAQSDTKELQFDESNIEIVEISEDDLQKYRNDEKFNYEVIEEKNELWEGVKNWFYNLFRSFFEWLFGAENAVGYLAIFLRIVPYILLGLLLYLIIKFFIHANTRVLIQAQQNANLVLLTEEEKILQSEDIQQLIKDAIAKKDFRLAVRYYYLYLLKLLSDKELITWQVQKTNDDYLKELKNSDLKLQFAKATLLYDYVWYGGFHIKENDYERASEVFNTFKKTVSNND